MGRKKKIWKENFVLSSKLPINIALPKAYLLADVRYNSKNWTRVYELDNGIVVVAVVSQSRPLSKQVLVELESNKKLTANNIELISEKIRYEIGLDEEMQSLREYRKKDILVDIALKSNPGFRLYANSNTTETTILTILSQNIDFFAYHTLVENFLSKYGKAVPWNRKLRLFPSDETIAKMTVEDWNKLNVGYKDKYLGNITSEDLENIRIYTFYPDYDRGLDGLMQTEGVGEYTARCLMIFAGRRYNLAFKDSYVEEVLNHKYNFNRVMTMNEFDKWIIKRWPRDPALVLYAHIQDYLPAYIRDLEYEEIVAYVEEKYN